MIETIKFPLSIVADTEEFKDLESPKNAIDETPVTTILPAVNTNNVAKQSFFPKTNRPYFTLCFIFSMWLSFGLGIFLLIGIKNVKVNLASPISPPEDSDLWFYTISPFPHCVDLRYQAWRLFTLQFVHSGLRHIGFNSLAFFPSSLILESHQGTLKTILIFQLGVVAGTLGYSYFSPYVGLVGASSGIYSIVGALFANYILNADVLPLVVILSLGFCILLQISIEILCYKYYYDANTAYTAHWSGFIAGFLCGFSILKIEKGNKFKTILRRISQLGLTSYIIFLVYHYAISWPPTESSNLQFRPDSKSQCCAELFFIAKNESLSISAISQNFYCYNDKLHSYRDFK